MKIRQQRVRGPKLVSRANKQLCLSFETHRRALNRANARRSHTKPPLCPLDSLGISFRNFKMLFVQSDIVEIFLSQWRERPQSHMQCDVGNLGPGGPALFKHCRRKVQTRCRRRGRPRLNRKHCLISLPVGRSRRTLNIRWQRHLAKPLDQALDRRRASQANLPLAKFALLQNLRRKFFTEENPVSPPHPFRRLGQAVPNVAFFAPQQQNFHFRPCRVIAPPVQPRRKYARVVQNQAVARTNVLAEIPKPIVVKRLLFSGDDQHPRRTALGRRFLCDQLARQIIIEIGNLQTLILGIESSCDETAAAVVEDSRRIRSSVVSSQFDVHARYGGVVPELASREHLRAIVPVVNQALEQAGISLAGLNAIAVTSGPGLVGSLLVGVTYAKALCLASGLPLIAVHHVEGHIHSVLLEHPEISFPAVALVASGGHTHLFEVLSIGEYRLLGKTRDDAAGEAYDKVAKLLGFGYPGGPIIDKLAPFGNPHAVKFTIAKMKGNDLDFSFSGHKTAVLRWSRQRNMQAEIDARRNLVRPSLEELRAATPQATLDLLASFQFTVVEELLRRATAAAVQIGAQSILVAGGVAGNTALRRRADESRDFDFYFPDRSLTTDNAAMIAAAAFPKYARREFAGFDLKAQAGLVLA